MAKRIKETPEQIEEIKNRFQYQRVFAIQYVTSYGSVTRIWDSNGYTKKFTLEEAREAAKQRFKPGTTIKICKGWAVIETLEV